MDTSVKDLYPLKLLGAVIGLLILTTLTGLKRYSGSSVEYRVMVPSRNYGPR